MGGMSSAVLSKVADQQQSQSGAGYTPAQTRATYNPAFSSQQTAQPAPQGLPQQMAPQAPQGLQGLMAQMMSRYQSPYQMMQRAPMPQYRSSALNYRPDMSGAQQNLGRVAKSVVLQQKEAAEAELAAMREAQEAAAQQPSYYDYGGNGG
jgi:hypothetical protein